MVSVAKGGKHLSYGSEEQTKTKFVDAMICFFPQFSMLDVLLEDPVPSFLLSKSLIDSPTSYIGLITSVLATGQQ